jgi:toxin ParE1/3/4
MERLQVLVAAPAEAELEEAYLHIQRDSPVNAARWRAGLLDAAATLETCPKRCRLAPESGPFEVEVRQLLYGNYRLLFVVREGAVVILHVRHGARDWIRPEDVVPPDAP